MGYLRRRIIAKSFTTTSAPPLLSSALFASRMNVSALCLLTSVLPCRPARKRPRQRQRRDVPCRPPRLLRMVRKIFLHHANDSHRALSIGHARQSVPSRHAQQFITHQEAL